MPQKSFLLFLCLLCMISLTSCLAQKNKPSNKEADYIRYVDIYDVVKEASVTDVEYTGKFSKYMTEDVFKHTNYKRYCENFPEYVRPFKVDFSLKEVYQTKDTENNLVYVDMIYSILIKDANGKEAGGSLDCGTTFTVKMNDNGWHIIDKREYSDGRLR